ncbi:hypothetical protein H257_04232 [Aphanomyces astaci]|uniref:Uncharacterized protein n=1 Tax=Aphanomyces astaci TaxID=112090 RepID=W4GX75_APHAT|nr:hypothetical protein H257_04232 [Aphanomyces astaci]ETV83518.1 hypothetical protein H257_04232 [Aphanomyces astaci]|eukprot:XP_009826948.1 hypothetical protein H257_04232 [Aphanomyces astaci]
MSRSHHFGVLNTLFFRRAVGLVDPSPLGLLTFLFLIFLFFFAVGSTVRSIPSFCTQLGSGFRLLLRSLLSFRLLGRWVFLFDTRAMDAARALPMALFDLASSSIVFRISSLLDSSTSVAPPTTRTNGGPVTGTSSSVSLPAAAGAVAAAFGFWAISFEFFALLSVP